MIVLYNIILSIMEHYFFYIIVLLSKCVISCILFKYSSSQCCHMMAAMNRSNVDKFKSHIYIKDGHVPGIKSNHGVSELFRVICID